MTLARREVLKAIRAAGIATACAPWIASCWRRPGQLAAARPGVPPPRGAVDSWLVSTCGACPGGCGIRARLVSGRLVGIAGNPLHPINRGGLCPLGLAGVHAVYHPDRIRGPLMRSAGEMRPVSWEDGQSAVVARLRDLRGRGLSHTVVLVDGARGLSRELAGRFLAAYGSPNHLDGRAWSDVSATEAVRAMQGVETAVAYDIENARFVLAFGSGWLEGAWSPVGAARAYGVARRGRTSGRVEVVSVEPRLSVSAAHADEWVPVRPGTEGIFALGLLHMVLREGLESRDFLDHWGFGFEWLRALVLRDYHPDAVSERTGAPVPTIIRLARRFASTRPAVAIGDDRNGPGAQSAEVRMAIHALNAAVGGLNAPGGVLTPPPVPLDPLPALGNDEAGARGRASPRVGSGHAGGDLPALQAWLEGAGSYPVNLLIAYGADPLALLGGGERARAALAKVPMVVSFASFLDDTARQAHLVLPDHSYLERWQDDPTFTSRGFPVLGIRQPVLQPRHDTRHAAEALAAIGRAVGGAVGEALPWSDFREVIRHGVRGIHASGRGALFDVPEAGSWVETMERSGWRASNFGAFDEFWNGLTARGGWWDPIYDFGERGRVLRTSSKKFDFGALASRLDPASPKGTGAAAASAGSAPAGYPLRLHLYPLLAAFGDSQGPLPLVQDVLGREMEQSWSLWVEIAPSDARSLGLRNGSPVTVESEEGAVEARVKVYPGVRPGVAAMPVGPGGAPGLAWPRALRAQAGALVALRRGQPGGEPSLGDAWVRLRKA
jgi:anaerobic selenocysteine-containing dehydrogenase